MKITRKQLRKIIREYADTAAFDDAEYEMAIQDDMMSKDQLAAKVLEAVEDEIENVGSDMAARNLLDQIERGHETGLYGDEYLPWVKILENQLSGPFTTFRPTTLIQQLTEDALLDLYTFYWERF